MKIQSIPGKICFALAMLIFAGCEDSLTDILDPDSGTIRVTLDAASCGTNRTGTLTPFIDGQPKNAWTNARGGASKNYTHKQGSYVISANWTDGSTFSYTWPSKSIYLYPNETYKYLIRCSN